MHANMHLKMPKYALKPPKYALKNCKTSIYIKLQKCIKIVANFCKLEISMNMKVSTMIFFVLFAYFYFASSINDVHI